MGYNTYYNLSIWDAAHVDEHPEEVDILAALRAECEDAEAALDEYGSAGEHWTWYEHVRDMAEFSRKYPDAIFELSGEGDNAEDLWRKYFLNGRVQLAPAQIEYDDFNPLKLEEVSQ